jgi:hypothetical protein
MEPFRCNLFAEWARLHKPAAFAEEHGFGEDKSVASHVSASNALGGIPDVSDIIGQSSTPATNAGDKLIPCDSNTLGAGFLQHQNKARLAITATR